MPSPSQMLRLSRDCYYVDDSLLPFGHSTKGLREQLGSGKELGLEGVRSLLGLWSLHDRQYSSSAALERHTTYNLEGERHYFNSKIWHRIKPPERTSIHGFESTATTELTGLIADYTRVHTLEVLDKPKEEERNKFPSHATQDREAVLQYR